jgi:hypothetical protein
MYNVLQIFFETNTSLVLSDNDEISKKVMFIVSWPPNETLREMDALRRARAKVSLVKLLLGLPNPVITLDTINVVAQRPGITCLSCSPPSKDLRNLFIVAGFVKIVGPNNFLANPGIAKITFLATANPREGRIGDVVVGNNAVVVPFHKTRLVLKVIPVNELLDVRQNTTTIEQFDILRQIN